MIDEIFKNDCKAFVNDNKQILDLLRDKTIYITGATGLIGSHLVYSLVYSNRLLNSNIKIIAAARSQEKAKFKFLEILDEIDLHISDISCQQIVHSDIDFIIHGASVTSSRDFVDKPVDTIFTTFEGTKNILNLAREKKVEKMVYLSSLEVYGNNKHKEVLSEDDYGYIDFTQTRSSYSEGKRFAECLCMSYSSQYGIPVSTARLTQTFGPGVDYRDNRVFAQFARSVIEGKPIILHTEGQTKRSYCYTKDAVSAILHILVLGRNNEAYNISNKDTYISIREMAECVVAIDQKKQSKVIIDIQDPTKLGYNPIVKVNLNTNKLESLGWSPTVNLNQMFISLIKSMQVSENKVNN